MKKTISTALATTMFAQVALAQFDEFPPPPPPPAADFSSPPSSAGGFGGNEVSLPPPSSSGGSARGGSGSGDADKKGVLSKKTQNKFNSAGPEDITNENFPETIESFDFPNVEITDLVKAMGDLTGKNFIIDPGVRGKITILAPSKLTVAEAYKAFLSALAINGFTVVPSGAFLKIKSARNAQRDSIETYSGSYYPNTDQMITRIIHLKHISAEQVNRDLRILPSKDGEMSVYTPTNSIILSDYGSNIDRVMKIINQLDVPGFEEQLEIIPIKFAKAKDMADLVDKIVNKGQKSQGGGMTNSFSAGVPRFSRTGSSGASGQQGASSFMAIPDDRTNSIIIVGNKSGILRVKKLISQLDFRIPPGENGGVHVYYVKYGEAEKIAQTLTGVTKDAAPKPNQGPSSLLSPMGMMGGQMTPPTEVFGGDVKITADKNTNSLVIVASKQDYDTVMGLLNQLDIPRDQVFVEAIIMEMNANDSSAYGVGYYKFGDSGIGKTGFSSGVELNDILSPTGGTGKAMLNFSSGKTVNVTDPTSGKTVGIPNLLAFISFIKRVTKANILSTPQITAMDNQEAEIEVGDRVVTSVTKTAGTASTGDTYTPNFEDATIKLNIKPFISPSSDAIRMEIKQNISQLSNIQAPAVLKDQTQALAKRSIKTNIVVKNGDTAILGGLIKEQDTETISKVPLLGDIPILGWLFKSRSSSKDKVNMVVFLTPKIIRNPSDSHSVIGKTLDKRLDFIKEQGGRDPYGRVVDEVMQNTSLAPKPEKVKTE